MAFHVQILFSNDTKQRIEYKLSDIKRIIKASPLSKARRLIPIEPWLIDDCLDLDSDIKRIDIKRGKFND